MKKKCSLRIDMVYTGSCPAWQYFHRLAGANHSLLPSLPFPDNEISASGIYSSFLDIVEFRDMDKLREWGKNCAESVLPQEIRLELSKSGSGDVLFIVPPEWAEVPFELFYTGDDFLCNRFAIGTIICTDKKCRSVELNIADQEFLIIADPSQDVPAAYNEGMALRNLGNAHRKTTHFVSSGSKEKIRSKAETASIVHFAGHSANRPDDETMSGWRLENGVLFDLIDMRRLCDNKGVPWLVFSNSCHAGNSGCDQDLAGMAGAFLQSGVAQVIGPVAAVNDVSARKFALHFYDNLFNGMNAGEAILAARRKLSSCAADITRMLYRLYGDPCFSALPDDVVIIDHKRLSTKLKTAIIIGIIATALLIAILCIPTGNNVIYIPVKH